ncbi:MAG: SdpI family protein [Ruthenibacterium sp.]
MKKNKLTILIWLLAILPLLMTLFLYARLPAQIPSHWDMHGTVDGFLSPRGLIWFSLPPLALALMLQILPYLDPKRKNYEKFARAYLAVRLTLELFLFLTHCLLLYNAFYPAVLHMDAVLMALMGGMFCVLGNFMPKFRHNYFVGIRTPWTLASAECWRRTHRFAGPLWVIAGLCLIVLAFFVRGTALLWSSTAILTVFCGGSIVYSFVIYKKCKND